jgi:signal transduction histidine kinase
VKEAVLNLVLNALDATGRAASVRVSWARDGGSVVVTVDDTGAGMSAAVAARAGEAFFTTRAGAPASACAWPGGWPRSTAGRWSSRAPRGAGRGRG